MDAAVTPGQRDPRTTGFGPRDYGAAAALLVCAGAALALAAAAETARCAAGAAMLAGWWAWHGPRMALDAAPPEHGR